MNLPQEMTLETEDFNVKFSFWAFISPSICLPLSVQIKNYTMQLNKIKKHTLAAFASNGTANANDFMSDFKKHLEETFYVDKATIIGIVHSSHDSQNAMTVYFAYVTPEKKMDKESKNGK